jgi:di/tricarboxylate transporter
MTGEQAAAFAIVGGMMVVLVSGRLRYDIAAVLALLVAIAAGLVPFDKAFSGFSDDIVIIVGAALVVSAAIARSGVTDLVVQRFAPRLTTVRLQLFALTASVAVMSAFVKNIGALAIMLPVAFQMARRSGVSPSLYLMPMAFASLLGGLMTLVGTSPNIIVARVRAEMGDAPFRMFDFLPVGGALTVVGLLFLVLCYRLLPERVPATGGLEAAIDIKNYMTEASVPEGSPFAGKTVADVQRLADGQGMVTALLRGGRRMPPLPDANLREGDLLLLEGRPEGLDRMVAGGGLTLAKDRRPTTEEPNDEVEAVEAVVGESSRLIGLSAKNLALFQAFGVNLLAISRRGTRLGDRLGDVTLQAGDVVVLQGNVRRMPDVLRELDCLPLAERRIRLGSGRKGLLAVAILSAAMVVTALGIVPVAVAFFAAAALMVLARAIPLREAYGAVEGPILVMLAALIPVADSLRTTGATDLIASALSSMASALPPAGALALIMVAAMAVTPFLNNAATVLVMAPIAAAFATALGHRPDAFLMAVAIGAGCDFLTPIGHQCNTLVFGPGGYRFGDYARLGLPLSLIVVAVAVPLLLVVWPL